MKPLAITLALAYVLAAALAPTYVDAGWTSLAAEVLLMLAMAQMWNLLAGYTGLVSLGHQAFIGVGAYLVFYVSDRFEIHPFALLPVAGLACALVAALLAPLLFRLRDAYFSVGIWVFAEIVYLLATKTRELGSTNGVALKSMRLVDTETFARNTFWIAAALALLAVGGVYLLIRSRLGLGLVAVRDNELAATSIGIDVWRNRLAAFVISAFGCGIAGATYFMGTMFVSPEAGFDINWVVAMMFIVIIGGIGTIEGPIIGTLVYFGLREGFTALAGVSGSWYLVAMGTVAIVVMLLAPRGLWGWARERWGWQGFSQRRVPPAALEGEQA
ncbi:MAG: branched-chain amino acid ABC transporter permease [Rubrivivax sp.]|jgi:branched-chain amino acid transport system permease protein|nr:branched-chain amino acid ABC transporter permease [Rubrivivax sp.]